MSWPAGSQHIRLHSILSLRYRILILCFLFFLSVPHAGYSENALTLDVSVQGVKGKLYDNIMARLRINIFRQNSNLTETEIRRLHRLAETDIQSALAPYGYYAATITSSLTKTASGWQATYLVNPGEQVHIAEISVSIAGEGASLPELAEPQQLFDLPKGAPLNQVRYEEGKMELLRKVRRLGFLDASYRVHEIRINRITKEAEIELVLDTGPRYLFGPMTSEQDIIHDELLQRFLPWKEGDHYIPREVLNLQRDLNRSDYFSSVIVQADTEHPDGLSVPVKIMLEPLETYNRYSFGVGYATDIRAYARFDWQNRLLNKSGHRANSSLLLGERESHLALNYRIPVSDPRYNTLRLSGLLNRESWEDTTTESYSAGVGYEYLTPERHLDISLEALNESYEIGTTKGRSELLMPGIQGSLAIADDLVNPTQGLRASVGLVGASDYLFSDASFLKVRADGKIIVTPLQDFRLIGRGSFGVILVDSIDDIPPTLRFYAGGQNSVRGYSYRSLGPKDSSGSVVGGSYLLTGSIELERSLSEFWRAAVFYDVGNAMDDVSVDLAHGIGIGVGVALPFGQARLELAYPLSDEGSAQYVSISIGADL